MAGSTLPYVLAAHRDSQKLLRLDDEFDASTVCPVTTRASVAQGKALLKVFQSVMRESLKDEMHRESLQALDDFGLAMRGPDPVIRPSGHLPPLWGAVCSAASLPVDMSAYVYLFKHAQSVLSAEVRASAIGPYQAQTLLASRWMKSSIEAALAAEWDTRVADAAHAVPIMVFWSTMHDRLYTRMFSS